jgi:ribokinase
VADSGKFGSDAHGTTLRSVMAQHNVDISLSETVENTPSGQAYILLQDGGENSIIIVAAANAVRFQVKPSLIF